MILFALRPYPSVPGTLNRLRKNSVLYQGTTLQAAEKRGFDWGINFSPG
jgi:hypothetical protein